jgi:hypothetical protein
VRPVPAQAAGRGASRKGPHVRRRQVVSFLVLLGIVVLIVGGLAVFRDRLSNPATSLQAGDCFDVPSTITVSEVQHHPCSEPHDGEALLVANYPAAAGAPYPASADFQSWVETICQPAFTAYVGKPIDEATDVDLAFMRPTQDGWTGKNDRQVICYLTPTQQGTRVSTSYKSRPGSS